LLVTPTALGVAAFGHPEWLSAPVLVGGLALLAAAAGLWLAMGLFATLGPQRTRTVSQVLSAFTGAAFFLATQLRSWLPAEQAAAIRRQTDAWAASPAFAPDSPLIWPARAFLGGLGPAVAIAIVSAAVFGATTSILGRRFAANAAAGAGRESGARKAKGGAGAFSRGAFRATVRKELRLLGRDPALMSQVLLRLLYLLPLLLLLLRDADDRGGPLAPLSGGDHLHDRHAGRQPGLGHRLDRGRARPAGFLPRPPRPAAPRQADRGARARSYPCGPPHRAADGP
jgi:ABC-2 type transport system permease protein